MMINIKNTQFINFRPERPIEVALNILYGTDEIEYVVERVERSQDDDRINESAGELRMCGSDRLGVVDSARHNSKRR